MDRGILKSIISQNVDGLHRRSGFPRNKLGVLHGCVFTEKCETCGTEAFHDVDLGGVSFQPTGNACGTCGGVMRDTVLDWDDGLPPAEWGPAERAFGAADVCLALGTSLRIIPAADMPARARGRRLAAAPRRGRGPWTRWRRVFADAARARWHWDRGRGRRGGSRSWGRGGARGGVRGGFGGEIAGGGAGGISYRIIRWCSFVVVFWWVPWDR